jgi:hypothetical protein
MAKIIQDDLVDALKAAEGAVTSTIPAGYIPIELSTAGALGAPAKFHIRNFDTSDILNLAISDESEIPEKVSKILDDLIYEDISVLDFHEKEVVELLVRIYQAFFSQILKDVDFPYTEEDLKALKTKFGPAEYDVKITELKNRKYVPKTDIFLSEVSTLDVNEDNPVHREIYISHKNTGFKAGFGFPKFGDVLVLRKFIKDYFRQKDKQFAHIRETLEFRNNAKERILQGEEINLRSLPSIPTSEIEAFKEYEEEKTYYGVLALKALHLIHLDGVDLSNTPLSEKLLLAKDPRLDFNMSKKVTDYFGNLKIGIEEKIEMRNPFTAQNEVRRYSFRLLHLLQSLKLHDSDEYDIDFK